MFHFIAKNSFSASAGDLLMIADDGTVTVSQSLLSLRVAQAQTTISVSPVVEQPTPVRTRRHHYEKTRKLHRRNDADIENQRGRILAFAVNVAREFTLDELVSSFYTGYVSSNDRRRVSLRDDCRRLAALNLLRDTGKTPVSYTLPETAASANV